jgi:hypothetical protein
MQSYGQTASQYTRDRLPFGYRSPQYDDESYDGPFDFASATSSGRDDFVRREDPPEEFGGSQVVSKGVLVSRDPEAAVATADGKVIPANASPSAASETDEDKEEREAMEKERQQQQIKEWEQRTLEAKSAKNGNTSKVSMNKGQRKVNPPRQPRYSTYRTCLRTTAHCQPTTPAPSAINSRATKRKVSP